MDTQLEQISPVECRVRVTIPWSEVSGRLDTKMKDLRRRARLPGFRPGKAPRAMLEKRFGRGVRDELARELVQETFQTAVVQHETNPLTQPVVESTTMEKGEPFSYAARFEVAPAIEVSGYEGLAVRRRPARVEDEQVQKALEDKQRELIEIRPIEDTERATQAGDIWTMDVSGSIGDEQITRKDVKVEIGSEEGEFIPGLSAAVADLELSAVGETREIEFMPPRDRVRAEFAGLTAKLTVGLRDVREKFVPELDDELARDTGDAETIDELRDVIRAKLVEEDEEQAEVEARRRLVESLLELNEFEVAPSMIAREVQAQVNLYRQRFTAQGLSLEQLGLDEQRLANEMRPQATFNVKAFLMLDAVGKAQGIEISDEELEAEVESLAEERGQNAARLRAQMESSQELLLLRAQMREERILDYLMEQAEVTEAPDPESASDASDASDAEEE
jgi:trigger factor